MSIHVLAAGLGSGIAALGTYSAQAAARANGVSAAAQKAQGAFNQASANNANTIGSDRIAEQYNYNSAQAAQANAFTQHMWEQSAAFNAEQAALNRAFQERMDNTKYQRAVKDMEKAGLNPILAATNGISTGNVGGSAASISGATGQMASGGLMNGIAASEGNYTGQMEYMGGILGLLSAGIAGLSSAFKNLGSLGDIGKSIYEAFTDKFESDSYSTGKGLQKEAYSWARDNIPYFGQKWYTKNFHGGSHGTFGNSYNRIP